MDIKGVCYDVGRQYNDYFLTASWSSAWAPSRPCSPGA